MSSYSLSSGQILNLYIPSFLSEETLEMVDEALYASQLTSYALLGTNLIFNIFFGSCLSLLWGMLNAISSIIILNLISINIPGVA